MSLKSPHSPTLDDLKVYSEIIPLVFVAREGGGLRGILGDCEIDVRGKDRKMIEEIISALPDIIRLALQKEEAERKLERAEDKIEMLEEKLDRSDPFQSPS